VGAISVPLIGDPAEVGGTTDYVGAVSEGTPFSLTAPTVSGYTNFVEWQGCSLVSGPFGTTCEVDEITADHVITVVYTTPTYGLTVNSTGAPSVPITADPNTYSGQTSFVTDVPSDVAVSLMAPIRVGDFEFASWTGCASVDGPSGSTCLLGHLSEPTGVTANYQAIDFLIFGSGFE
jgi:hypothetical protein